MWIGAAGTGVTGVRVHLSNQTTVTATVGSGYFAAWWPSQARASCMRMLRPPQGGFGKRCSRGAVPFVRSGRTGTHQNPPAW